VIGGGPGGISVAWQLRQKGHQAVVYDMAKKLGGKIASVIPESRIPRKVVSAEIERIGRVIPHVHLQQSISKEEFDRIRKDFDFVVIATGAVRPISLSVPGADRMMPATEFLVKAKAGTITPGQRVVVIGAGNVGCDVATEAHRLGADDITLIDIQPPASFGNERQAAEAAGAKFRWPCFTESVTPEGVRLTDGQMLAADTVVIAIGDRPDLSYLSDDIATERGYITVNKHFQTSAPRVLAIGDAVKPGLLTDAIGAGRKAAGAIIDIIEGKTPVSRDIEMLDIRRVSTEYFDPRVTGFDDVKHCGSQCASCGACRDCGICVAVCPQAAIRREERSGADYQYVVDESLCIGCGFCAGACPCGVWNLVGNEPME